MNRALAAVAALALALAAVPCPSGAQEAERATAQGDTPPSTQSATRPHLVAPLPAALALARLCVNESGLRAYTRDDCAAIHAVIAFRAERIYRSSYVEALHRYSRGVTVHRPGRPRPWIAHLWPDGRTPIDYCQTCSWERGRRWWSRTYEHARRIVRGEVVPRCEPHSWARSDVRPADPSAHPVDCGQTLNVFWVVPAYAHRWGPS